MKLAELSEGIYKIKEKDVSIVHGNRRGRQVHLLRVTGVGDKRKYFIDHNTMGEHPHHISFKRDFEIMCRYHGIPEVNRPEIRISFSDGNDIFEFEVADTWALRDIFEELTWLQKPFGYEPRRKRVNKHR